MDKSASMDLNYYEVLGISQTATAAEVEQAYRKVSKIYHPDAHDGISNPALFAAATKARDTLTDAQMRSLYDALLARPTVEPFPGYESRRPEPRAYTGPTPPRSTSKRGYVAEDLNRKTTRPKSPSLLLVVLALVVINSLVSHVNGPSVINHVLVLFIWISLIGTFTVPKKITQRFYTLIRRIVSKSWSRRRLKINANK
jgi:curved DNA-binding protein CbpA